jgi:nucleoside-diphosphate-sugar epimerase
MSTPQRILVTGATGFIGHHLVADLLKRGYEVIALTRKSNNLSLFPQEIETIEADLTDITEHDLASAMRQKSVHVVVHLAAVMDFYPKDTEYLMRVNVDGTQKLAAASAQVKVERFIYVSTTETIGGTDPRNTHPANEMTSCNPNYLYGRSKVIAEQSIKDLGEKNKLNYVILRPTGVYGPDDDFALFEVMKTIESGLLFFFPGPSSGKFMFIHVDDVLSSILLAISSSKAMGGTYIICPDDPMTYRETILHLASELNRIPPLFTIPQPIVKFVVKMLGPVFNYGKRRIFLFHPYTVDRMLEDRWFTNEKAKKDLGFKPKYSFREGLSHTVKAHIAARRLRGTFLSPLAKCGLLFALIIIFYVLIFKKV